MKILFFMLTLFLSMFSFTQLVYVDNFDGVYPYPTTSTSQYSIDINNDQLVDVKLVMTYGSAGIVYCGSTNGNTNVTASFQGFNNAIGQNKVNSPVSATVVGIDCVNDTLNAFDQWNNTSKLYYGWYPSQQLCLDLGIGAHKQGFRLILNNPANGALGYKYGYIDYTITPSGDIIIHGWYYENTFNVPIVANSQLAYPYDGNCIYYDTVVVNETITTTVYDTITTTIYDTITTTVNDTIYTTVTDTLVINTTLGLPAPNNTNAILIYPNPASDHITIDNGNFALMAGYSIRIENSSGQQVFQSGINQAQFYIDISAWPGNGLYFVHLIDAQNNTVTIRKIILE